MKRFKNVRDGVVIPLSGGMDSTTLASMAVERFGYDNVYALGFNYGQRHASELKSAHNVASYLKIDFHVLELPRIFDDGSALMNEDYDINRHENQSYRELAEEFGSQPTVVANRNMNFIALATSHALVQGVNHVWLGMHADDAENFAYPDCTIGFVGAMAAAVQISSEGAVNLQAPLNDLTKGEIVRLADQYDAPLQLTQSCYQGKYPQCGVCSTCIDRQKAFRWAGFKDPVPYETTLTDPIGLDGQEWNVLPAPEWHILH